MADTALQHVQPDQQLPPLTVTQRRRIDSSELVDRSAKRPEHAIHANIRSLYTQVDNRAIWKMQPVDLWKR
jgi:hypothetical protein